MIGRVIAHYTIKEKLGQGGMGEVYRAEDSKLGRDVALKVLPAAFAENGERMARFSREAQVLASLNHPNLGAIYGVEESEGVHCLVLELVEGEDLTKRIERGPVPLDEALTITRQIAAGLEAAHDRGVIHRDLKPANIKVTADGSVKVLDFGLAKAMVDDLGASDPSLSLSPTVTTPATQLGMILGTAGYMAPEQAKGKEADRRADIWALGVVLHEMLTGAKLFAGETVSETLAAVMMMAPDLDALPDGTPLPIRRLLERCLEKDPTQRLQAVGEARILIDRYRSNPQEGESAAAGTPVPAQSAWSRRLPWMVAAAMGLALVVSWFSPWAPAPVEAPSMRLRVEVAPEESLARSTGAAAVLSPDGTMLAYVAGSGAQRQLYRRSLGQVDGTALSGTGDAAAPFFSPDGKWIGFFTSSALKKVSIAGGAPLTLTSTQQNRGGTWTADGTIVFAPDITSGLAKIPHTGGTPEPITERNPGERSHRWPYFLPDGKHVLFIAQDDGKEYDDATIEVVHVDTKERKVIHEGGTYPRYLPTGHLTYVRDGTLFAVPFDADRLEVTGTPAPVLEEVLFEPGASTGDGTAQYAFSSNGTLAYLQGSVSVREYPVVWADRAGQTSPLIDEARPYNAPRMSPDGRRIVVQISGDGGSHIWIYEIDRGAMTRLTFAAGSENILPVWSTDGKWVAFGSTRESATDLYRVRADGSGQPERITNDPAAQSPGSFSPDGHVAVHYQHPDTTWDLHVHRFDDGSFSEAETFLATPATEIYPEFSPDGRWIAYTSNESGQFEIYVRPYPGPGGKWQLSTDGGGMPRWTKGGRELVYRNGGQWHAVPLVVEGESLRVGRPELLFTANFINQAPFADYDVSGDGERFVVFPGGDDEGGSRHTHLNLILNWFSEVERLAPSGG